MPTCKAILLLAGASLLATCNREPRALPPVTVIDGRDRPQAAALPPSPPPSPPPAVTAAPAAPVPPQPAGAAPHPAFCEVEISGQMKLPAGVKGPRMVYVAYDDCLAKDARIVGRAPAGDDGHFFTEVFVKWGTDVSLCAAVEDAAGKPARVYGKATGNYHAQAAGEVEFRNVVIELKEAAPHTFPPPVQNPLQ